jgi:hypothetical protein
MGSFVEQRTARDEAAAILTQRLGRFYSRFAPHKLQNVPSAVERYVERQAEMNLILKSLYGADLGWEDVCASASEGGSDMMSIQSRDREFVGSPPASSTSSLPRASPTKPSPIKDGASEVTPLLPVTRAQAHTTRPSTHPTIALFCEPRAAVGADSGRPSRRVGRQEEHRVFRVPWQEALSNS